MKKIILLISIFFALQTAFAQPEKGSWFVGGKVGVFSFIPRENASTYIGYKLLPEFGYMISKKLGTSLAFEYTKNSFLIKPSRFDQSFGIKHSFYFYFKISKKLFFSINPYYSFQRNYFTYQFESISGNISELTTIYKNTNVRIGINPNIQFFLHRKLSIYLELNNLISFDYIISVPKRIMFSNLSFSDRFRFNFFDPFQFMPTLGFNFWIHPKKIEEVK